MLPSNKVLRCNDTAGNFFLTLRVAILINATLSVSLNEATGIATKHTTNTIHPALNSSVVHSVDRLSATSASPLRSHNSLANRRRNTRTGSRVYKVIRVTPRRIARKDTTRSILAQIAQGDRCKVVQANETSNRVPCLADAVIVNRLDNDLDRLRRCGPDAIPNISNSINRRLEPAPDLVKAATNSAKHIIAHPHPNSEIG